MTIKSLVAIDGMGPAESVARVTACDLTLAPRRWSYQVDNAAEIDRHWHLQRAKNPQMFNGVVHLLAGGRCDGDGFAGELLATDFKSYLHWRDAGFPPADVRDVFCSALIRSAEGHVILGRQRAGNINAGIAHLPGGFIDARDVAPPDKIDIAASIMRELHEETGLRPEEFRIAPGYLLTQYNAQLSIGFELVSPLPSVALRDRILQHISSDPESELIDAVIVRSTDEARAAGAQPYVGLLLEWLFAAR